MRPDLTRVSSPAARILGAAVLFLCLAFAASVSAQGAATPWDRWDAEATAARAVVDAGDATQEALDATRARLDGQIDAARRISAKAAEDVGRLRIELEALGPAPEEGAAEAPEAASLREELNARIAEARALRGRADRVIARARELQQEMLALDQQRFLDRLGTLGPSPADPSAWTAAAAFAAEAVDRIGREVSQSWRAPGAREFALSRLPLAIVAVLAALFIAFGVRAFAVGAMLRRAETSDRRRQRLILGAGASAARLIMLAGAAALAFYGLSATGLFGLAGEAALRGLAAGFMIVIIAYAIGATLFSPEAGRLRPSNMDDAAARSALRNTLLLGLALALAAFMARIDEALSPPAEAAAALRFVAIALGGLGLWRLARTMRPVVVAAAESAEAGVATQALRIIRRAAVVVAVLAPVLALVGYGLAAEFLLSGVVRSLALLAVLAMVYFVVRELVEIHLADQEKSTAGDRMRLIPIFAGFVLFCLSIPALALIWGADWSDLSAAYDRLAAGFSIGEVSLSPMDFVTFALVFGLGYTLTRAAQRVLKGNVLPKTGMSSGAADALSSGVGYVGVFIAAIAAITATGLDLSNLAIVAGALSVGIGFGLQNIVNNFVSGVILLVERPIKVGDWIEVGGVHGTVKKVNVRSTEIETFDRASYILPNSDLIAGAVTNYTHANTVGRVIVPVGVAYGSDTKLVEKLLLEAAEGHPMLLSNPPTTVYFTNFGADALEFELRCYLQDVNWVLSVKSDLLFRIEEKLGEAGIEIPYAQRDLHIRNVEALAAALKGDAKTGGDAGSAVKSPETD